MKRFLTILFATLLLSAVLCVSVSASSFDGAAEELSAIGIFKGSASGFQLDQAPTRSQAAIMLVRLYGAEEEAKAAYAAGNIKCPFADVGETAAPYVAWLVEKGVANGVSADSFGAANPCTGKAYTIFLLRALGYKDGEDFTTANAQEFGLTRGLFSPSALTGTFLRDDLAALTYQALACDLKDGSTYLLDSLIKSGAINAAAAKPVTDKIETYRSLQSVTTETMGGCLDADISMKAGFSYSMKGQSGGTPLDMAESMEFTGSGNAKVRMTEEDMEMAMTLGLKMEDETMDAEMWLKDGMVYVRSGEETYKEEIPGLAELSASAMPVKANAALLPFLESVTSKTSGTDTIYTLALNDALANTADDFISKIFSFMADAGQISTASSMDGSVFTYTLDKDGQLKNASVSFNIGFTMDINLGEGEQGTFKISMKMDMDMDVKATGKDVKITFPDFSDFKEASASAANERVIGGADGPTSIFATAIPA